MAAMISYSIGYTAIDAAAASVTVAPPPAYAAGDLLIMGVIAGGTAGSAVPADAPPGWTALSGSGSAPGVFAKTATDSEPPSYTVTLGGPATAAAFVAAYPAASVAGGSAAASDDDAIWYSPAFPADVSAGQTVLLVAAAVASANDVNGNAGYQNVNLPSGSGWTTEVPVFGPALPDNTNGVYPCAIGLADIAGSASSPTLSSPQGCTIYAAYLVLDITGTADPLSVTATAAYPEGIPGMALTVKALSGAAAPAAISAGGATATFYASGTAQPPQAPVTPNASGSVVYGAVTENFGVTSGSSFTANPASTFTQNVADTASTCIYGTFQSASATTAGTAVTLGGSAPVNGYATAALAEILAASGSTLAETAAATAAGTVPGDFASTAVAQTAVFRSAPSAGSLLVAMVSANSSWGQGNASVSVTDSSGRTWTPLAERVYPSYSGVWIGAAASAADEPPAA
jgi:hypothetical protein